MKTYEFTSKSENDTKNLAKKLAAKLQNTGIIVLTGDLGCGKTKFVEGFLSYYSLEDEISSPTFTIVNEYIKNNINIYHFDVYRLSDSSDFLAIGGEEYFENGICLIEWGELIEDVLPNNYIHIYFDKDKEDENIRLIKIESKEDLF